MGLLQGTDQDYYQGNNYGDYQFTSLDAIISQFQIAYVGEGKIIPKIKRADIAFHAMRALQELSFDTFKSVKAQEIVLPPSLKMILPRDYVNYTQVSWIDDAGIKHPLYPTKHTSNPFSIVQEDDGDYLFSSESELIEDNTFSNPSGTINPNWSKSPLSTSLKADPTDTATGAFATSSLARMFGGGFRIQQSNSTNTLGFRHASQPVPGGGGSFVYEGRALAVWQQIDVTTIDFLDLSASVNAFQNDLAGTTYSTSVPDGEVVIGIQTQPGDTNSRTNGNSQQLATPGFLSRNINKPDIGYLEWNSSDAGTNTLKETTIDVSSYQHVYFIVISRVAVTTEERDTTGQTVGVGTTTPAVFPIQYTFENLIHEVSLQNVVPPSTLGHADPLTNDSTTWSNYKTQTTNERRVIDYDYDDPRFQNLDKGQRYGLNPSSAQSNGSFYIDNLQGYINFSSNVSGKTVVLDYISDSLGTDEEMKVHKFAEEAMYKSMLCDIASARPNVSHGAIRRYKQEKRAARRAAKLRLSNIKLNDITQIFRNKSKIIK